MHGTLGHMACSWLDSRHGCSIAPPPKRARFYPTAAIAQASGAGASGSCLVTTGSCLGSLVAAARTSRKRKLRAHSNRVPCIQLGGLDWLPSGGRPPTAVVEAVKAALVSHGVFTVEGHGVPMGTLMRAREESLSFFDLPLQEKQRCAVHGMERNRGYEIYPHHQRFLEQWTEICSLPSDAHPEPSAVQGIVCERFCCGPPTVCEPDGENEVAWKSEKFYNSEYGQVFFPPNVWPVNSKCTKLRPALLDAFQALERFSEAILMLLAAAVDMEPQDFQQLMFDVSGHPRHASMLQVCNYPSLLPRALRPTELSEYQLRAKAHQDFGAFTLLARCPGTDSGKLQCGKSGALEVKLPSGKWMCVPARTEELTVMPGTLMEYLTAGRCRGVMHRVTNPPPKTASASRRLSLTFVVKPDYTAAAVPPGSALASRASTPTLGDLWRVGWQEKQRLTGAMPHGEAVQHFRRHRQDLRKRLLLET